MSIQFPSTHYVLNCLTESIDSKRRELSISSSVNIKPESEIEPID